MCAHRDTHVYIPHVYECRELYHNHIFTDIKTHNKKVLVEVIKGTSMYDLQKTQYTIYKGKNGQKEIS